MFSFKGKKDKIHALTREYQYQIMVYSEMSDLARKQKLCLSAKQLDLELLSRLIDKRQHLMEKIGQSNQILLSIKHELQTQLKLLKGELLAYLEENDPDFSKVRQTLRIIMEEIKEIDLNNEEILRKQVEETREALKKVRQDKKAVKFYGGHNISEKSVFLDDNI